MIADDNTVVGLIGGAHPECICGRTHVIAVTFLPRRRRRINRTWCCCCFVGAWQSLCTPSSSMAKSLETSKRRASCPPEPKPKPEMHRLTLNFFGWRIEYQFETEIIWTNVIIMGLLQVGGLYGFFLVLFRASVASGIFAIIYAAITSQGVTAGAHRLYSHVSYKARLPLRILLMLLNTATLQQDIYKWTRDHRVHHKYSDTDADPHNSKRGFFFSHMGWLLCKKHPAVLEKGNNIDMSDVLADPVVQFQRKYYYPMALVLFMVVPTLIPVYGWHESVWNAFWVCVVFRYFYHLHNIFLVNSWAHSDLGMRAYDASIPPCNSTFVSIITHGEGWHNYHHIFPYDYSASEFTYWTHFNLTTMFIELFAAIGWAYDLRKPSAEMVRARVERTGLPAVHATESQHSSRRAGVVYGVANTILAFLTHFWVPLIVRYIYVRFYS